MAVDRKSQPKWLWILLLIVVFALPLIWWMSDTDGDPDLTDAEVVGANTPGADPVTAPEPVAAEATVTIADILGSPADHIGHDGVVLTGVTVPEVPTDRGFWIEDQGQRLFAVVIDNPREAPVDIDPGQRLAITEGMIRDATFIPQIPGEDLDPDTRRILDEQDVFLVVDEANIENLSRNDEPLVAASRRALSHAA
ncbi:hypothetical protein [Altericroceibacterium xinjiangense]|uniref:hypothetical protein n=1 Tax=Altericroceibacterium xinjiangense TaxID=762261 RepID=UPI000F7DCE61|nr:hypothetical protein [Altericroceibacterium xinjiangense]